MPTFHVTFGVQYAYEPHPFLPEAHPDGYLEVEARDEEQARLLTNALTDGAWAFMHEPNEDDCAYHPRGAVGWLSYRTAR